MPDRALTALRRLLSDAAAGGQAKVDALMALSERPVVVATWTPGEASFRTLVNSSGLTALPVFTDPGQLNEAAQRFGWLAGPDPVPTMELSAKDAMRHVVSHNLQYLVVDITAPHSLELSMDELRPILSARARRESGGVVRPTPPPGALSAVGPAVSVPQAAALPREAVMQSMTNQPQRPGGSAPPGVTATTKRLSQIPPPSGASVTFGSGASSVTFRSLDGPAPEELLDGIANLLKDYPEVEWAALVWAARGPAAARPTIGLRVDTGFRTRLNEIISKMRVAGDEHGAALDVLLLDDPQLMRNARSSGVVFYPWRKK
jgi:hypothetical protein